MDRIEWTQGYAYGVEYKGKINGILLFTIIWATMPRGYTGPQYQLTTTLPGVAFKEKQLYTTAEQAKAMAEQRLESWLQRIRVVPS